MKEKEGLHMNQVSLMYQRVQVNLDIISILQEPHEVKIIGFFWGVGIKEFSLNKIKNAG
jgi:hypothetical protein